MRAVIQKVKYAKLIIDSEIYSQIEEGLMVLLGIEDADTKEDIEWLADKIRKLRIFEDENGVMNLSVEDVKGEMMIVSQFTLHASTKKGNRPTYIRASKPEFSKPMYESFVARTREVFAGKVATGVFGADMQIELVNNGPTTIIIDTKNKE
ncbi:MAG: D-tyrosyl-tRNA(Tyr) deacylase [Bacteroidales bacterium]|jgi:D-tyrosyl-tRNA(Tyr) deacylase|nr:D-tyrosyl-tRNA(Tyr) deacylase [Bacteroidales bacterium]MBO5963816.1 D-tyrosyl-tRNA(Tyr) deacylase [Bacteroidales bacterium]MBO7228336.1 D-tyrosyl-tRNA(Tyr) deacylase [Bacteroidales bacterium]MBQ1190695.1 D-tyrosyl-tRNA(Tyr) deacylase [Bacteroidales bacterium]MBQ2386799.1 D-tyrosyl-tRNA(Tyr) deacylase [Bacteroidales bacterium]